jgi:hypothetical protein
MAKNRKTRNKKTDSRLEKSLDSLMGKLGYSAPDDGYNMVAMEELDYFLDNFYYIETSRMQDEISVRGQAMTGQIPFYKAERIISELNAYREYQLSELKKSMPHVGIIRYVEYSIPKQIKAPQMEIEVLDEGQGYLVRPHFLEY